MARQITKQLAAYVVIGLLFFGSWAYTVWLKDVPGDSPHFGVLLGLSGPTLVSFASHGSFALWLIAIGIVLAPIAIAIRKESVSWWTAAWSGSLWLFECVAFGGLFLLWGPG
jgi:hypothetical protein